MVDKAMIKAAGTSGDNSAKVSVLRRKARAGQQEHLATAMSPEKAIRLAMAKSADQLFGLELTVNSAVIERILKADVAGHFRDEDLLLLLEGSGGATGAIALDMQVVSALVEHQTVGVVSARAATMRATTRVDAAMAAPLVDAMMQRLATLLDEEKEAVWVRGYRFGAKLEDRRALDLILDSHKFFLLRMQIDLGGGAKAGEVMLLLPHRTRAVVTPASGAVGEVSSERQAMTFQSVVMQTPAEMTAVLARISLPFDALRALRVGDVLPLPGEAVAAAMLEAGQAQPVVAVTLGQVNGYRAVRLGRRDQPEGGGGGADPAEGLTVSDKSANSLFETDRTAGAAGEKWQGGAVTSPPSSAPDAIAGQGDGTGGTPVGDDVPGLVELPGLVDPTDLQDLPDIGALSDNEDLPDLNSLADLPDLPGLQGVQDRPDLPNLPDLESTP